MHVSGGNMRLDNNRGFIIEDAAGAAKRVLFADPSNVLHLGSGGGGGFNRIDFDLGAAGTVMTLSGGHAGIGTVVPENSEGWSRVLDLLGAQHAKLSVRTNAINARVIAHESGWWGAPAGMVVGTKGNHLFEFGYQRGCAPDDSSERKRRHRDNSADPEVRSLRECGCQQCLSRRCRT